MPNKVKATRSKKDKMYTGPKVGINIILATNKEETVPFSHTKLFLL